MGLSQREQWYVSISPPYFFTSVTDMNIVSSNPLRHAWFTSALIAFLLQWLSSPELYSYPEWDRKNEQAGSTNWSEPPPSLNQQFPVSWNVSTIHRECHRCFFCWQMRQFFCKCKCCLLARRIIWRFAPGRHRNQFDRINPTCIALLMHVNAVRTTVYLWYTKHDQFDQFLIETTMFNVFLPFSKCRIDARSVLVSNSFHDLIFKFPLMTDQEKKTWHYLLFYKNDGECLTFNVSFVFWIRLPEPGVCLDCA